jgi:predicted 3-demethylubiquinone-9 3-methyltransferase (glyoxalase superfamily)
MQDTQRITPCLWFDDQAEEAVEFYTAIFRNSKIVKIARYGEAGHEVHGKPAGTVMTVAFELDGQALYRAQRRADVQIQRGHLVPGQL